MVVLPHFATFLELGYRFPARSMEISIPDFFQTRVQSPPNIKEWFAWVNQLRLLEEPSHNYIDTNQEFYSIWAGGLHFNSRRLYWVCINTNIKNQQWHKNTGGTYRKSERFIRSYKRHVNRQENVQWLDTSRIDNNVENVKCWHTISRDYYPQVFPLDRVKSLLSI